MVVAVSLKYIFDGLLEWELRYKTDVTEKDMGRHSAEVALAKAKYLKVVVEKRAKKLSDFSTHIFLN